FQSGDLTVLVVHGVVHMTEAGPLVMADLDTDSKRLRLTHRTTIRRSRVHRPRSVTIMTRRTTVEPRRERDGSRDGNCRGIRRGRRRRNSRTHAPPPPVPCLTSEAGPMACL